MIQIALHYPYLRRYLFRHESFNHIALLYIVEIGDIDAALHAVANFAGIVFEALERADLALVNLYAVAHQAHVGITLDHTIEHIATSNGSRLGHAESLAHLGTAQISFL